MGYEYLFPFEKIKHGERILIYGAGNTGIEYLRQAMITQYCEVIGIVDLHADKIPPMVVPVYPISEVSSLTYDWIVIAMQNPIFNEKIISDLSKEGVEKQKILFVGKRNDNVNVYINKNEKNDGQGLAFEKNGISVAVRISGGIGDAIIAKKFVDRIIELAPEANIDIYSSSMAAKHVFNKTSQVNSFVHPNMARFDEVCSNYMLSVEHLYFLKFCSFQYEEIQRVNIIFADMMKNLYEASQKYIDDCSINGMLYVYFQRAAFRKTSVYEFPLYYQHILGIKDRKVNIPLQDEWKEKFYELHIKSYITMNYGNGVGGTVSKQWPLKYFNSLVAMVHGAFPKIKIVQLGDKLADHITGCDKYILGENLELVKYVLKNSLLHIDIEGGLVHVATQFKTVCIVLFGPTPLEAFGYKGNINLRAGNCHNCVCLESNVYKCARGMNPAPCMLAIKPEMVMEKVVEYLKGRNLQK